MVMPEQKPGRSEQVVCTPTDFLDAVRRRLGIVHEPYVENDDFAIDLAASEDNAVVDEYFTEADDSLIQDWAKATMFGWGWCNPPYADIEPWVAKGWLESRNGAKSALLVPASTGSNWWAKWVEGKAYITFLNGRITFVGHRSPYPKDLVLLLYAPFLEGGSCVWRWKK